MFSHVCLLLAMCHVAFGINSQLDERWNEWKLSYGKVYSTLTEETTRRQAWETTLVTVETHNGRAGVPYTLEMNTFADRSSIANPSGHLRRPYREQTEDARMSNLRFAPAGWDWRTKGAITSVKNDPLGNVLPLVLIETVESYTIIHSGKLTDLSQPEASDCCANFHLQIANVFQCVHDIGGLCSRAAYPTARQVCRNDTCTPAAQVNGGRTVAEGDENQLLLAVLKTPLMVLVDASHVTFQLYQGGIYSDPNCNATELDHAMQLVGYGVLGGQEYWICKNSWGTGWGMNGYMLMARNKGNMCGIASRAEYPV